MNPITISAKSLGAFSDDAAWQRCLWIGLHVKNLPYQIFPGIFSSIDAYTKRVVHGHFDKAKRMPEWLSSLGEVERYIEPPSYKTFSITDQKLGVTLRGTVDGIFKLSDSSHVIVDYKTAKYTPGQESLLPIYETQLNAYAYIGERLRFRPVSGLALIYMEPVTDPKAATQVDIVNNRGFAMGFGATIVKVPKTSEATIPPLLRRVRSIYDLPKCPTSTPGCSDCESLMTLVQALGYRLDDELRRETVALAKSAYCSGVGAITTMGIGQSKSFGPARK